MLDLELVMDDRAIDMVEEGLDVALRMGNLPDSTATARRLATGRRSLVATRAYLLRAGVPSTPAEVAEHQAVIYTRYDVPAWTFRHASGAEASVIVSGRIKVTAAEGLRAAVLADMGLAVASDWMFARELANGAVVRVLEDWALPPLDLWALFPSGRMASAKARAFADFVAVSLKG